MAVIGMASMTDQLKPDSTLTNTNADYMLFQTGATIVAASLLAPGSAKLHCDAAVAKQANCGVLALITDGIGTTAADEHCVTFIYKATQAPNSSVLVCTAGSNPSGALRLSLKTNLVAGATVLQMFYDNAQVGSNYTITVNNVYRIGIYVNYSTTTVKLYVDDVTSGVDIRVGSATLRASSTSVTMTNTPATANYTFGQGSGGAGSIQEFQHICVIDTSGSFNIDPASRVLDPICITDKAVPIGAGTYFQSPFTSTSGTPYTDVDEVPPDNDTSYISAPLVNGTPVKASFAMTQWSTCGSSLSDTVLAVRVMPLASQVVTAAHEALLRSGTTDHVDPSPVAWTVPYKYDSFTFVQSDPNTSGPWSVAAFNVAEAGDRVSWFGVNTTPKITFIRMDAAFIRSSFKPRTLIVDQAVNRAATY